MLHRRILLPLILIPGLSWADSPHCAVSLATSSPGQGVAAGQFTPPPPILPLANQPAGNGQAALGHAARAAASGTPASAPKLSRAAVTQDGPQPKLLSAAAIQASPALVRLASAGAKLYDLGSSHGMRGVFAASGSHFQVFYITPDGQAEIGGIMWDATGNDLTLPEVRNIPGVIPTVTVGDTSGSQPATRVSYDQGAASGQAAAASPGGASQEGPSPAAVVQALEASTHGDIGPAGAPHLFMLVDPLCSYSIRAIQQLAPYATAGKLHLTVIPLSVLDYEDQGASTTKAEIMVSQPPGQMVADWLQGLPEEAGQGAQALLSGNMVLAKALALKGTPTFIWQGADGRLNRIDGAPPDIGAMIASLGSSS